MRPIYQPTRGRRGEQRDVAVTYSRALRCCWVSSRRREPARPPHVHDVVDRLGDSSGRPNALLLDRSSSGLHVCCGTRRVSCFADEASIHRSLGFRRRTSVRAIRRQVRKFRPRWPVGAWRATSCCKIFLHCVGPTISFSARVGTCMHTCAGLPVVCLENEQFMSSLCVGKLIIVRSQRLV
jgi:hypothetical protein